MNKHAWDNFGFTPILLDLLICDYEWTPDEIDKCFAETMGDDYHLVKGMVWAERLEVKGYKFPDGVPVVDVLDEVLTDYWGVNRKHPFIH
jgi:hypothetical protein